MEPSRQKREGLARGVSACRRERENDMKILMVLTSHDQLGDTGKKTGFWLEEFAAPYYAFRDAGAEVTVVSPLGGQPPLDPKSDQPDAQTVATERFKADVAAQATARHDRQARRGFRR